MTSVPPAPHAEDGSSRAEEDRRLLIRYHRHGDQAAREQLVQRLLPLARRMARRYRRSDEPLDDLVQVATLGLIKAIDRFDPARETAFSSYAVPTMLGELKRYFRDNGWAVHVPRGMQERVMQVDSTVKDMSRRLGRSPSAKEIAEALNLSIEQVLEAMEAASAYDAVSLDSYRFGDEGDGETYAESIGELDDAVRAGRIRRHDRADAAGAAAARPDRAAPALRRGHDAGGDRRARRRQPDARLAADPPCAGTLAHRRRTLRLKSRFSVRSRADFEPHVGRAFAHAPRVRDAVHEVQAPAALERRLRPHLDLRPLAVALVDDLPDHRPVRADLQRQRDRALRPELDAVGDELGDDELQVFQHLGREDLVEDLERGAGLMRRVLGGRELEAELHLGRCPLGARPRVRAP